MASSNQFIAANPHSRASIDRRTSMFITLPLEQLHQSRAGIGSSSCTFSDDPTNDGTSTGRKPQVKYQNTYKLSPDGRVPIAKIESMMEHLLMDHLEDLDYNENLGRRLVKLLSDKILGAVKKLGLKRYKFVVLVNIGQLNRNSVRVASRCLWQDAHDSFAEVTFEGKSLWATAVTYALYHE